MDLMLPDGQAHPYSIGPNERASLHFLPVVKQVASKLKQSDLPLKRVVADGAFGARFNGPEDNVSIDSMLYLSV